MGAARRLPKLVNHPIDAVPTSDGSLRTWAAEGDRLVGSLLEACRDQLVAVLLYGSRLTKTSPDKHSAFDLILVVEDYRRFYGGLKAAGHLHRSPWAMAVLNHVLTPNSISHQPDKDTAAKCLVLERAHFDRALSNRAKDHFCLGRMVQQVAILYTRDQRAASDVEHALETSHRTPLRWALPFLEAPFTAREFARGMVAVSYAGEIRPEKGGRTSEVIGAQGDFFDRIYTPVLDEAVANGLLVEEDGSYRPRRAPSWWARVRVRIYFMSSRIRSTMRWVKHVYTYEGWPEYIVRKVERRIGVSVEITPAERRFPVILLWPKVIRVLASRPRAKAEDTNRAGDT
ncbi:MAG: hypothetical protein BMS9Abin29_0981 [Gemmatimonadota bacterium]|nr:MAG: hypothetical protein BMS9Abin29_0981 [Gemmatimonadota bacterium]